MTKKRRFYRCEYQCFHCQGTGYIPFIILRHPEEKWFKAKGEVPPKPIPTEPIPCYACETEGSFWIDIPADIWENPSATWRRALRKTPNSRNKLKRPLTVIPPEDDDD